jgi:signal transduction histidine kinase
VFVAQDHLGLFDTPPDRRHVRISLVIVGLLLVSLALILPVRNIRLREVDGIVPTLDAVMFVGDLITATLLYAQASVFRSRALTFLGTGYLYTALLFIPHVLTFPGAFSETGLLDAGANTAAWLSNFRRMVFPVAIALYVGFKREDLSARSELTRPPPGIGAGVLAAFVVAGAVTLLATLGHDLLPPLLRGRSGTLYTDAITYESVILVLLAGATALLFRARSSVLDMWLLVALVGWLVQSVLVMSLQGRFTAGWYLLYGLTLVPHLIVTLALVAESNRLYARLALATSARNREREARLMSIDAVAVAIAHEVGQPLTAVNLQAKSSLKSLTRPTPDVEKAVGSLRAAIEAAHRTTDVLKSIRGMFAERPDRATDVNLNDLVRTTAALLSRELDGEHVSLQLRLDETLPPVLADRVQMQRVLLNLFTNAIEALAATRGRARRIAVRSAEVNGHDVLIEVSDNGVGIDAGEVEHIFEAFHTTKPTGSGVGLSLCRTIVGAHGGLLWATPGKGHGATFHLQLPRSDLPAAIHSAG